MDKLRLDREGGQFSASLPASVKIVYSSRFVRPQNAFFNGEDDFCGDDNARKGCESRRKTRGGALTMRCSIKKMNFTVMTTNEKQLLLLKILIYTICTILHRWHRSKANVSRIVHNAALYNKI